MLSGDVRGLISVLFRYNSPRGSRRYSIITRLFASNA